MSDIITLLPDSVANQIAAGEVIQRPASVIKELVENSVDAGATTITVIVKDAGRTLIQVVDNGSGMSDTDARLSFERHATSKIKSADDLFSLHTMGFRGEALASIAAISQVDMRTMQHGATLGTRLLINASKVESQQPETCVPGTNIMVKNIFFNVPARRKFLKKDAVEMSNIMREYERLALVNTGVELTMIHNDVTVSMLRPGNLKRRICELFGKSLEKQIIPIETEVSFVKISGFISLPEHARRRNALQYFFVNGRNMRHPYFHKAVVNCYDQLIPADLQPCYFISLEVDPSSIDVNIHPTKHEIKFENEKEICQVMTAAIREALGKFNAVPAIDFNVDDAPDIPVFSPNTSGEHGLDIDLTYNPFNEADNKRGQSAGNSYSRLNSTRPSALNNWEKLYENFNADKGVESSGVEPGGYDLSRGERLPGLNETEDTRSVLQIANRYILTPTKNGVMLVDRHRAHLLVLYEKYVEMVKQHRFTTQKILFPETVILSPSANVTLTSLMPILRSLGFELTNTGDNEWSILGVPAELGHINPSDIIIDIIENTAEMAGEPGEQLFRALAISMARAACSNAQHTVTDSQAEQLLADLLRLPAPAYTPDGLSVLTSISMDDLSRML